MYRDSVGLPVHFVFFGGIAMYEVTEQVEEAVAWLRDLKDKVSKRVWMDDRFGGYYSSECTRKLTMEEFQHFKSVAPLFIVVPGIAQFGFNFGVTLYVEPPPLFPGVEVDLGDYVFFISGEYLPDEVGQRFENSWAALSPLSHSPENIQKLLRNKQELPKDKRYYEY